MFIHEIENWTSFQWDAARLSEVERVALSTAKVWSSVARKLGVAIPNSKEPTHYIDGILEMMLEAVMNYDIPLTHQRVFEWHRVLFPFGKRGYPDVLVVGHGKEASCFSTLESKVDSLNNKRILPK